jgi:hypothetical protein
MPTLDFLSFEEATKLFTYKPETGEIIRNSDGVVLNAIPKSHEVCVNIPNTNPRRRLSGSRLVFLLYTGRYPIHQIYCIDGNRQNLKWENLVEVKPGMNISSKKNGTGIRGIHKVGNSYVIRTTFNDVPICFSSTKHSLDEMKEILSSYKLKIWNELLQNNC